MWTQRLRTVETDEDEMELSVHMVVLRLAVTWIQPQTLLLQRNHMELL